ncbi:DUF2161 domain-containing phosphodiesterase [Mesorhizobium sp. M0830]
MPNVEKILRRNVYGWFVRSERGPATSLSQDIPRLKT